MKQPSAKYRWNTSAAAEAYDAAAPAIHPYYTAVQDAILAALPFERSEPFLLVDLGAGSGRFAERFLAAFANASAVLVDQSEPFLALAERRLARFGPRVKLIERRLQDNWASELATAPQAIVSMSAIHHLEAAEKQSLFARCYGALAPGGVFINGDEYRPESDAEFLAVLEWWAEHMRSGLTNGRVPPTFEPIFDHWHARNIRNFGTPNKSGDDCQETLEAQRGYLTSCGFRNAEVTWNQRLWAVLRADK
jgi:SAM-dependent methyltransferase